MAHLFGLTSVELYRHTHGAPAGQSLSVSHWS
jgi:hypothetical protein